MELQSLVISYVHKSLAVSRVNIFMSQYFVLLCVSKNIFMKEHWNFPALPHHLQRTMHKGDEIFRDDIPRSDRVKECKCYEWSVSPS